jgi:hypothetical protein
MNFIDTIEQIIYHSQKKFGILEFIEFIAFSLIVYKYNPFNISSKYPLFSQISVLLVGFIYVLLFFFVKHHVIGITDFFDIGLKNPTEADFIWRIIGTLVLCLVFIMLTVGIFWLFRTKMLFITLFKYSIISLFLIGIVGIIVLLTTNWLPKLLGNSKILNLIKNLILFLPCLLISFIDYIRYEYSITTKPVWIILFMELVLVLLWLILPLITSFAVKKYGKNLLNEPLYLNKQYNLGSFENFNPDAQAEDTKKKFNYNYSISAWFTINPQPPNTRAAYTKYTTILNYGNKPCIEYNSEKGSLRIMAENGTSLAEIYETKNIIMQKWNNIVINYDGGTMDVFLNGVLVGSKPNIVPYMTFETILIGEDRGLEGGICNVVYYDHILSNRTIKMVYNTLKDKKIPVF